MEKFNEVFTYLQRKEYPHEADKVQKRSIRRSASLYEVKNGEVVLKGTNRRWVADVEEQKRILEACHDNPLGKKKINYIFIISVSSIKTV